MTGLYVLIAGPDGTGKSTIAQGLQTALATHGLPVRTSHWRPHRIAGGRAASTSTVVDPHGQRARSPLAGLAKLGVVYADHLIGGWTTWRRARREGVLIVERGWLDVLVDPRRYRVSSGLARWWARGGRALPKADLALVCSGDAARIHARKPEIGADEVGRQCAAWEQMAHLAAQDVVVLDTVDQPVDVAVRSATDTVLARLEASGAWRRVPLSPGRLALRTQGRFDPTGLFRPQTQRSAVAATLARPVPALLRARAEAPLPHLAELWSLLGIRPAGVGAMRSSAPDRWVLRATSPAGDFIFKVGLADDAGLRNEAEFLALPLREGLSWHRPVPVFGGPWRDRFVVATLAEDVRRGTEVPLDTAVRILEELRDATADGGPLTHGDFAPWNLPMTPSGPLLLDWEEARSCREPLWDLTHYLVVVGALLGRYSPTEVAKLLITPESPGRRLLALDPGTDLVSRVRHYLTVGNPRDVRVRRFRDELLARIPA